jgi:hypothetical protein
MSTLLTVLATWCAISLALSLILGPMLANRFQPNDSAPVMGVLHG